MPKSRGKGKVKNESKTVKLNRIWGERRKIQDELDEINRTVTGLEAEYQIDATGRKAYQKYTHNMLLTAYDRQHSLNEKLQQKQAKCEAVEAEHESSNGDDSKESGGSRSSNGGRSSGSSAPAIIGWECVCGMVNFTDPWGDDNMCNCGHQFCDVEGRRTVHWNP